MLQLEVIYGRDAGKSMNFQQSVVRIGTDPGNDFQLSDPEVSEHHGKLMCRHEAGHYSYCDMQSARGTRVRSTSIDVLLQSHQLEQSVALAGECMIFLGQSMIRCTNFANAVCEQRKVKCVKKCSMHTQENVQDAEFLSFLLDTSMALSRKTTHHSVMSLLSIALMQHFQQLAHIAIWRYDVCRGSFSCIFERSRLNEFAAAGIRECDFREAMETHQAWLYSTQDNPDCGCTIVVPLLAAKRELGVMLVESNDLEGLDLKALDALVSVAGVAANAIDRTFYNADMSAVFDGFVRSIIAVMDARDPASSGHSMRVAEYAIYTAQAIQVSQLPAFQNITFSKNHLDELRFASLLHDIGKVVLKREILLKSAKLMASELQQLLERIDLFAAWFGTQKESDLGPKYRTAQQFELYREMVTRVVQAQARASVKDRELIEEMCHTYITPCPNLPLLKPQERESLLIDRGTLNNEERQEIQRHALISWQYLSEIAWPERWANVPIYVLQHHEKLNGTGYPYGISGDQIFLQSRIITICDIFDALTGGDRLYKTRHSYGDAARILKEDAQKGALDADIVDIFIEKVIPQISDPDLVE